MAIRDLARLLRHQPCPRWHSASARCLRPRRRSGARRGRPRCRKACSQAASRCRRRISVRAHRSPRHGTASDRPPASHPGRADFSDASLRIGRAANEEIVRRLAPVLAQPFDIRLKASAGYDKSLRADRDCSADALRFRPHSRRANIEAQATDLGFVANIDAERSAAPIVERSPAPCRRPGKTRWCAKAQRSRERRLEPHAVLFHPGQTCGRRANRHPRQLFVGLAAVTRCRSCQYSSS